MTLNFVCDQCGVDLEDDKFDYTNCRLCIEITNDTTLTLAADNTKRVDFCDEKCMMSFVQELRGE